MSAAVETRRLTLRVASSLRFLLARDLQDREAFTHVIVRRASIKDVVESLGVPHTEIGGLRVDGREVGFGHPVADGETLEVTAVAAPYDVTRPTRLRPEPLDGVRFLVDLNVARLAKLLRLAGFDAGHDPDWHDHELARRSADERRILLTRDRALLRHGCITFGHLVRAAGPRDQLGEVLHLFGLQQRCRPFSRCLRCNGLLEPVDKRAVLHRLEPLTRLYYEQFHLCRECGQVYWDGSHREGLQGILDRARQRGPS